MKQGWWWSRCGSTAPDTQGNSAVIEFLDGTMVVHRGKELPVAVLTNSTYETSLRYRADLKNGEVRHYEEMEHNSSGRFSKAADRLDKYEGQADPVAYAFATLDSVAQGEHTRWSIVYDVNNRVISYKTGANPLVQTIAMDDFNFSCGDRHLSRSIEATASGVEGFLPLTPEINMHSFTIMKEKLAFLKDLPEEEMKTIASWYRSVQCN
ncbi:MAG: hypothetical protein WC403_06285 [Proteiniphilum sp.]